MADRPINWIVRHFRRLVNRDGEGGRSDAELIERFVTARDEAAFELLVWRHASLVMGVCRRVLKHEQEAEDAFQATFLTLARKCGSIGNREAVASWLFKVAYRVALVARARSARRARTEGPLREVSVDDTAEDLLRMDLRPVLDEEINRLPEKHRIAFVLCCIEGLTTAEAARQIGCPVGTVGTHVARAREQLRGRLVRRGVVLSAGALAVEVTSRTALAEVPSGLTVSAVEAAIGYAAGSSVASARVIALTEGVLQAMAMSKLKMTAAVLGLVCLLGSGAGMLVQPAFAEKPSLSPRPPATAAGNPDRLLARADDKADAGAIDKVPEGMYGFSGELVGKVVSKDAEKGTLVLEVRQVTNVWKNNKAKQPRSCVGKTLMLDGVFGKFLDVLVILKPGDGVKIEAKHVKGDNLTFLGELLQKVDLPPAEKKDGEK